MDETEVRDDAPVAKPSLRSRLIILSIGAVALLGIVAMCIIFLILAANR